MGPLLGGLGVLALAISLLDQAASLKPALRVGGVAALIIGGGLIFG